MTSPRKPPRPLIPCIICSAEFKPRSALQITCSVPCQAERRKIRVRENYTRKPEIYRQYSLKYRAKDPEAVRQRNREYKAKKREAIRQRRLEYKANNLEAIRGRRRVRRSAAASGLQGALATSTIRAASAGMLLGPFVSSDHHYVLAI